MDNPIGGTDGKLGHDFISVDELQQIDIGSGDRPRPTYVSAKLDPEYKRELIDLLKEFKDCIAWEYYEMPSLDQSIVEQRHSTLQPSCHKQYCRRRSKTPVR